MLPYNDVDQCIIVVCTNAMRELTTFAEQDV